MPVLLPTGGFDESFERRCGALLALARDRLPGHEQVLVDVKNWFATELSMVVIRERRKQWIKEYRRQLDGQLTPPDRPSTRRTAPARLSALPEDVQVSMWGLEQAVTAMYASNATSQRDRLLGRGHPKQSLEFNALRVVVVAALVLDPDAEEWLVGLTDLAHCPWPKARSVVCQHRGHAALELLEEASAVLGWSGSPEQTNAEGVSGEASVAASSGREDELAREERFRVQATPEFLWRALVKRQASLSIPPVGTRPSLQNSNKRPSDRLTDLEPQMMARVELIADPGFTPSRYPGLRDNARGAQGGMGDGWIAWSILAELRTVLAFAEFHVTERADSVRAAVADAVKLAESFVRNRLATAPGVGFDDRAVCTAMIPRVLAGVGRPKNPARVPVPPVSANPFPRIESGPDYLAQDPTEPERLRVNRLLSIPSPWIPAPRPPSFARQIVEQLRDQGYPPVEVLRALELSNLADTPEATELCRELSPARVADGASSQRAPAPSASGSAVAPPTEPTAKPAPAAPAGVVALILGGPGDNPIVFGKPKPKLSAARYAVVKALQDSGVDGLTKDDLDRRSGRTDARRTLGRLAESDKDWGAVIQMAGVVGGRYRLRLAPP